MYEELKSALDAICGTEEKKPSALERYLAEPAEDDGTSEGAKKGWMKRHGGFSVRNLHPDYGKLADDLDAVAEKYPFYPIRAQGKNRDLDLEHGGGQSIENPKYDEAAQAVSDVINRHSGNRPGGLYERRSYGSAYRSVPYHSIYSKLSEGDKVFPGFSSVDCSVAEDNGTHEGAVKAAQTRKAHGGFRLGDDKVSAIERYLQDKGIEHRSLRHGGHINMPGMPKEQVYAMQRELSQNLGVSSSGGADRKRGHIQVMGIPMPQKTESAAA